MFSLHFFCSRRCFEGTEGLILSSRVTILKHTNWNRHKMKIRKLSLPRQNIRSLLHYKLFLTISKTSCSDITTCSKQEHIRIRKSCGRIASKTEKATLRNLWTSGIQEWPHSQGPPWNRSNGEARWAVPSGAKSLAAGTGTIGLPLSLLDHAAMARFKHSATRISTWAKDFCDDKYSNNGGNVLLFFLLAALFTKRSKRSTTCSFL